MDFAGAVLEHIAEVLSKIEWTLKHVVGSSLGEIQSELSEISNTLTNLYTAFNSWMTLLFFTFLIFGVLIVVLLGLKVFFEIKRYYDELELKLLLEKKRRQIVEA